MGWLSNLFGGSNNNLKEVLEKNPVIIDVRTPSEYKSGHVTGSKNIPLDQLKVKTDMIRGWKKPVVTVCRSGSRSEAARSMLASQGIEVVNGGPWTSVAKIVNG